MENEFVSVKQLPPGFRFDPTDEELVFHFLYSKATSLATSQHHDLIPEFEDFYHNYSHPAQLIDDDQAFESYGKWYFYTKKSENRMNENGYWIEMDLGNNQPIYSRSFSNKIMGIKKSFVCYKGKFPSGVNTGWFMQEYQLFNTAFGGDIHYKKRRILQPDVNKWVLCRVQRTYDDDSNQQLMKIFDNKDDDDYHMYNCEGELSLMDNVFLALQDDHDDEISSPFTNY